jgi:hypothetical protein
VFVFTAVALLEVGGDAVIRKGLYGSGLTVVFLGCVLLGCYRLVVNSVAWDFSKLLGVYIAFFALLSILCGRFVFQESVPASSWMGLVLIAVGGLLIQFG